MKITYIGYDNECTTKICNYLADYHEVTLITDRAPVYEIDCKTIVRSSIWEPDYFCDNESDMLIYNVRGKDFSLLNRWLDLSVGKVKSFIIIKEDDFLKQNNTNVSIEGLLQAEYTGKSGTRVCMLEVSALYGTITVPKEFRDIIKCILRSNVIDAVDGVNSALDALHIEDFCVFLEKYTEQIDSVVVDVASVRSCYSIETTDLLSKLSSRYPQAINNCEVKDTPKNAYDDAMHLDGWSPEHSFIDDFDWVCDEVESCLVKDKMVKRSNAKKSLAKVALFLIAFFAVELYTNFISVASDLQFVDMRIALIGLTAIIWGKKYAVTASVLCSVASVLQSILLGYRWYIIFFNVNNWIPVTIYIVFAIFAGICADKIRKEKTRG